MTTIIIDHDGTVQSNIKEKIRLAKLWFNIDLKPEHCEHSKAIFALTDNQYEMIVQRTMRMPELPPIKFAKEVINALINKGHKVYICTSRKTETAAFVPIFYKIYGIKYTDIIYTQSTHDEIRKGKASKLSSVLEKNAHYIIDDTYSKIRGIPEQAKQHSLRCVAILLSKHTNKHDIIIDNVKKMNWKEIAEHFGIQLPAK